MLSLTRHNGRCHYRFAGYNSDIMMRFIYIFSIAVVLICTPSADACPTCKSALHDGLMLGYAISILFMMAMPFVIFAFWAITIWRLRKKAAEEIMPEVS